MSTGPNSSSFSLFAELLSYWLGAAGGQAAPQLADLQSFQRLTLRLCERVDPVRAVVCDPVPADVRGRPD